MRNDSGPTTKGYSVCFVDNEVMYAKSFALLAHVVSLNNLLKIILKNDLM